MIIGIEYTKRVKDGLVVKNIPYKIHDRPCDEGCCKNDKTIGPRDRLRVNWLLNVFMPSKNITVFDYKYWFRRTNFVMERAPKKNYIIHSDNKISLRNKEILLFTLSSHQSIYQAFQRFYTFLDGGYHHHYKLLP